MLTILESLNSQHGQRHHMFDLNVSNAEAGRRNNYSLANYAVTEGQLKFNLRIATPPPGQDCPPGVGATFHFSIPVYSHAEFECIHQLKSPEKSIIRLKDRDLKMLIVENNRVNAKLLAAMLNKTGYSCDIAHSSTECIEYMGDGQYDVIFMDLNMPDMDGFELTARIQEQESHSDKANAQQSIVIAVTGWTMTGMKERCLEAGMNGYLSKPVIRDELKNMIGNLCAELPSLANK